MSDDVPDVTVLVPTRAAPERATSLRQAVESVLCQRDVRTRVIVMVNGATAEPDLPPDLLNDTRVTVLHLPAANLPAAFRQGIRAVATPFFATLDDDDVLLPDALKVRRAALARHPESVVVVTNGYRAHLGRDILHVTGEQRIQDDPLRELLRRNWLLPGSWLCRTTPATRAIFEAMPRHLECTYLGVRFAELGLIWVQEPTVRYNVGSPISESQSRAYVEGQAAALRQLLTLELPQYARRELRSRIAASHHRLANLALASGQLPQAWRWHLATLRSLSGWRYLPFLRHLLRGTLRART